MIKNISKALFIGFLLVFCTGILSACTTTAKSEDDKVPDEPAGSTLIGYPLESFSIVRPDNHAADTLGISKAMQQAISDKYGITLPLMTDWINPKDTDFDTSTPMILIGDTQFEESKGLSAGLKVNDYTVYVSETRIAIAGGSESAVNTAIEYVVGTLINSTDPAVKNGWEYKYTDVYSVESLSIGSKKLDEIIISGGKYDTGRTEQLASYIEANIGTPTVLSAVSSANIVIERKNDIGYFNYRITVNDGQLKLCGGGDSAINKMLEMLYAKLDGGSAVIDKSFECEGSIDCERKGEMRGLSAWEIIGEMSVGINLGNTLDGISGNVEPWSLDSETAWQSVRTTKEYITALRNAGFDTIRIPVTWYPHLDSDNNINEVWLSRVQEIVNWALDCGFYVILNTHHEGSWLKPIDSLYDTVEARYLKIWEQISERFKDYGDKLIFECLNEPREEGGTNEWNGGTTENQRVIMKLEEEFVKLIRSSGDNNASRLLLLPTVGASASESALATLTLPDDEMVAVSVHAYSPYTFAMDKNGSRYFDSSCKTELDKIFASIDKNFISKNIPVVMGEFGTIVSKPENQVAKWVDYYVGSATKLNIPCVWWDDNGDYKLFDRVTHESIRPSVLEAMLNAYKENIPAQ